MRVLVAGAAGFIGSSVCQALVYRGHQVVALDSFDETLYPAAPKIERAKWLASRFGIEVHALDVSREIPTQLWHGVEAVINEAAVPGLPPSWSRFDEYFRSNGLAVARLVASATQAGIRHFVQASTSSVYGRQAVADEDAPMRPVSPYGATKLAGEAIVRAYGDAQGLPFTILRYFSVYGPGQRPDMAYHQIAERILADAPIEIFGSGNQTRSNTFISDCVAATISAVEAKPAGETINVSGSESISLLDAIALLGSSMGRKPRLRFRPPRPGDQTHTAGVWKRAARLLDYEPRVPVREGLADQARWHLAGRPIDYSSKWCAW